MRPSDFEKAVLDAIVDAVQAPDGRPLIAAYHAASIERDPLQLAVGEVAVSTSPQFPRVGRHNSYVQVNDEAVVVSYRVPDRVHDQRLARREAQRVGERIILCLTQPGEDGLLRVPKASITPTSGPVLQQLEQSLLGRVTFQAVYGWNLMEDV